MRATPLAQPATLDDRHQYVTSAQLPLTLGYGSGILLDKERCFVFLRSTFPVARKPVNVDIAAVKANATKEGIDLQQITLKYEGLTAAEMRDLKARNLLPYELSESSGLGKFQEDGEALFPKKITAVIYL